MTEHAPFAQRLARAARRIVGQLQIDEFTHDGSSGAGFYTWEAGRRTWYLATETNIQDLLWNRWRYRPGAAVLTEAVQQIERMARRQAA